MRERSFLAVFAHWFTWSSINFKKNTSPMNANIFLKQIIVDRKVSKLQRDSSVTLHVSPKTPILEGSLKNFFTKIQISPLKIFPEWFVHKTIEPVRIWKSCIMNQLKLIFPKKCWFWSWKGLISEHCYMLYGKIVKIVKLCPQYDVCWTLRPSSTCFVGLWELIAHVFLLDFRVQQRHMLLVLRVQKNMCY